MKYREQIDIDGYLYVIEYRHNSFCLYLDVKNSRIPPPVSSDPFADWHELPPDKTSLQTKSKSVFRVKKMVDRFIDRVLSVDRPHYFSFSANEEQKENLYGRYALRLAEKYGYYLVKGQRVFKFYKVVWCD